MSESCPVPLPASAENKRYSFYAFISYKHLDKLWAKWVQSQLEHYRLPSRLCREKSIPRHVSPIFRDETDLLGGKTIHTLLEEKIRQSKYLIVICSRHMQIEPKYIDYEIETFLAAGNPSSRILPLIVDGEANSGDPGMECLPPSLKGMGDAMPLGIKLNRRDKKETVLKLIASILELDLQILRAHNQERRQRRIVAFLSGGLLFSLALGGFLAWEMLTVKQAGLHEQLTYAEDTFRQGDRLRAAASAQEISHSVLPLMDGAIRTEAERLAVLSAIAPKYQPMTRLCAVSGDSRLCFTSDGQQVMVITGGSVEKYDMQGQRVMVFETSQLIQEIAAVCPDGIHAVVQTTYLSAISGTNLFLWNMETDSSISWLISSDAYDMDTSKAGYLSDVVSACFSPDGKTVCAWRDGNGGYFNSSEELAAWDVRTGTKLFSFSADLLGTANRTNEIEAFEFIGNDTLHWTGSANHVFYTLGDSEPTVVSKRVYPLLRDKTKHTICHDRCTLAEGDSVQLTNLITQAEFSVNMNGLDAHWADFNGRYLFLWGTKADGRAAGMLLIDMMDMTVADFSDAFSELCAGHRVTLGNHAENSPYVYLTLDESDVYRLDMVQGELCAINVPLAAKYELIAHTGQMDVLSASIDSRTHIIEVADSAVRTYTIDAEHHRFVTSAAFGDGQTMAANHNGSYYLYPLCHPGVQLDEGLSFTGEAAYAASPDGSLLLKSGGTTLAAWKQGELLLYADLADEIRLVGAANGRFFALTSQALLLYDDQGELIAQYSAPEGQALCSAKITADGSRIAILHGDSSPFADNKYTLRLLDGDALQPVATVSPCVHVIVCSVYEAAYDLSDDGQWLSAIVRVTQPGESTYRLACQVWSAADGTLCAQTLGISKNVPTFDLSSQSSGIVSAARMQYVHFARSGMLLSGLQYGTWILDVAQPQTVTFISESANSDALPDMLSSGQLLYPASGLHVWDIASGRLAATLAHTPPSTELNAMLIADNQHRLYVSPDQQWVTIAGAEDTWLYSTADWSSSTVLAAQAAQVLYLDDTQMAFATEDGLWRLEYDLYIRKETTP